MTEVIHLNCVRIVTPVHDNVCGHCLLIKEQGKLVLIDTGIGWLDTQYPAERIGQQLIDAVGYRLDEMITALKQIEDLGLNPAQVTDCIISHLDNDHTGGLADFPGAVVHLGLEELENYQSGNTRYLHTPLAQGPLLKTYGKTGYTWFGLEARKVDTAIKTEIYLIPLFGHTSGHCGIALKVNGKWLLYVADAYYLRAELSDSDHPIQELARARADNDELRIASLDQIRNLIAAQPDIIVFGYHDIEEFRIYVN